MAACCVMISIHALHEESDPGLPRRVHVPVGISIHALHEESDASKKSSSTLISFQSTLSMRRATKAPSAWPSIATFQSTLSMRRATIPHVPWHVTQLISIHALHEESDPVQSADHAVGRHISIHALHEESDLAIKSGKQSIFRFQSTLSMRRATRPVRRYQTYLPISIHALHEESDPIFGRRWTQPAHFNPRSP